MEEDIKLLQERIEARCRLFDSVKDELSELRSNAISALSSVNGINAVLEDSGTRDVVCARIFELELKAIDRAMDEFMDKYKAVDGDIVLKKMEVSNDDNNIGYGMSS